MLNKMGVLYLNRTRFGTKNTRPNMSHSSHSGLKTHRSNHLPSLILDKKNTMDKDFSSVGTILFYFDIFLGFEPMR